MTNPIPSPSAPPRSQAQRLGDLSRERDRLAADLVKARRLLGQFRDAVFNLDDNASSTEITDLKRLMFDNWEAATPPGRSFDLMRAHDGTKVSGTGRVAEGYEFENGKVALCWLGQFSSVNIYEGIDHVRAIHGHGGSTEVVFHQNGDK